MTTHGPAEACTSAKDANLSPAADAPQRPKCALSRSCGKVSVADGEPLGAVGADGYYLWGGVGC